MGGCEFLLMTGAKWGRGCGQRRHRRIDTVRLGDTLVFNGGQPGV